MESLKKKITYDYSSSCSNSNLEGKQVMKNINYILII